MNKNELKEMFNNIKVGDTYNNLTIEGLNKTENDTVLQELARRKNLQFEITVNNNVFTYTVINPSKKFLKKEGQWCIKMSNKANEFLNSI